MEKRIDAGKVHYLIPASNAWARKLGVAASITPINPGPLSETAPPGESATVTLADPPFKSSLEDETVQARAFVTARDQ